MKCSPILSPGMPAIPCAPGLSPNESNSTHFIPVTTTVRTKPSNGGKFRAQQASGRSARPLLSLALMATVILSGCEKPAPPAPPPPVVQVMEVKKTNIPRSTTFIGKLDSPQNVQLRARVESFVQKIHFIEGTEVEEGTLLIELDKKPYIENLAAAKATLAEANAALSKSNIDVPRLQALVAKNAAPQRELDAVVTAKVVNEANVAAAEAKVKSAELDLGYCDVKAPLSGRIGAAEVPVGSLVGKGEPTVLATISQLDPIWFYCAVSEVDFLNADKLANEAGRKMGELPVQLILADGTEHPDPGKWVFVDRVVDATTATVRARAEFPNSRKALRPGMFARVRISLPTEEGNILVPERALVELQGKNFLWIAGADNKSTQRAVKVAPNRIGSQVIVLEGLQSGERVVVEGVQKLREGAPFQPAAAVPAAEAAKPAAGPAGPAPGGAAPPDKSTKAGPPAAGETTKGKE